MVDVSMSITTNGRVRRAIDRNERLPGAWLQDASGQPTDDPTVTQQVPPGTLQLLGGPDAGHKGFGLTLAVEAMTGGLAGYGRADHHQHFGANVMIRLTDISAFGDPSLFQAQTDWLIAACQKNRPISAAHPVRLPGERGLKNKADGLKNGLHLSPEILTKLSAMNYSDYPFPRPSQEHR